MSHEIWFLSNLFTSKRHLINSTKCVLIRITKPDQEIEGVEPFQSRIGSNSFGTKVVCHFVGWIRVLLTLLFDPNFKSNITT